MDGMEAVGLRVAMLLAALGVVFGFVRRRWAGRERLTAHPGRRRIVEIVARYYGINARRVEELAGLSRSATRHHLRLLEEAGVLKVLPLGRENHLFPQDVPEQDAKIMAQARHGRSWRILQVVLLHPGIRQKDIAEAVGMTRKILRGHLDRLSEEGLVDEQARTHSRRYYLGAGAGQTLRDALKDDLENPHHPIDDEVV